MARRNWTEFYRTEVKDVLGHTVSVYETKSKTPHHAAVRKHAFKQGLSSVTGKVALNNPLPLYFIEDTDEQPFMVTSTRAEYCVMERATFYRSRRQALRARIPSSIPGAREQARCVCNWMNRKYAQLTEAGELAVS